MSAREEQKITRKELNESEEYKHSLAIHKIMMEDACLPELRKYRRSFQIPLEVICGVGLPVAAYFLSKKGIISPNQDIPEIVRYGIGAVGGFAAGWSSGLILGSFTYEVFGTEGKVKEFFSRMKKRNN